MRQWLQRKEWNFTSQKYELFFLRLKKIISKEAEYIEKGLIFQHFCNELREIFMCETLNSTEETTGGITFCFQFRL